MKYARTITWLAIITGIIPLLAIPEWLIQTIVVAFVLAIIITAQMSQTESREVKGSSDFQLGPADQPADNKLNQSTQEDKPNTETASDEEPIDIEDSDPDQAVAESRWRRRSSRDIDA